MTDTTDIDCTEDAARAVKRAFNIVGQAGDALDPLVDFLSSAIPLVKQSHSQHFQDLWAAYEARDRAPEDCFFVEFGAANGLTISNTYMLEKHFGWSGILAEPNPSFADSIAENRSCIVSSKCVYSESGQTIDFLPARKKMLGRIAHIVPEDKQEKRGQRDADPIPVDTISLNDLLVEHNAPETIQFMSVDTEGSEFHILENFDFSKWDVRTICVEHSYTSARDDLKSLLSAHGYTRKWPSFTGPDDWYVRR